jgi:hypothetical protein
MHLRLARSAVESGEYGQSLIRRRWNGVALHKVGSRSVTALWISCAKISDKSVIEGAFDTPLLGGGGANRALFPCHEMIMSMLIYIDACQSFWCG